MADFIPGLELSGLFFAEVVRPLLARRFPGLRYAAALIGSGSEILGFDTPMSSDHHWGPRLMLFLDEADLAAQRAAVDNWLRTRLPPTFRGYSTHFSAPNPDDNGVQLMAPSLGGPVNHRVEMTTISRFFADYLDVNPDEPLEPADWLTFPEQKLRTLVGGAVYHDEIGLEAARARFAYYPRDVWLLLLAAAWTRIGQEEPFVGRAGSVGDELGSQIIAARLARDVMRLGFLMERQYAPYSKWFGTAFARLDCAERLTPHLRAALAAEFWPEREYSLGRAYAVAARMHNALGITPPLPAEVSSFHGRPFQVIHGERFAAAIRAALTDERVRRITTDIGSLDLFSDSTDLLSATHLRRRLTALYR